VSFVATDNYLGGVRAAEYLGDLLGGTGRAMVLRYQEGSASTVAREAGFLETLRDSYPGIEIVSDEQYGGPTVDTALVAAENLLSRFPDVDGVFAPCEPIATGMLVALRNAGRTGR
jgi:ribose transport system substrate-binding protein